MKIGQKGLQLINILKVDTVHRIGIQLVSRLLVMDCLSKRRKVTTNDLPLPKAEGELMLLEILSNYEDYVNRLLLKQLR